MKAFFPEVFRCAKSICLYAVIGVLLILDAGSPLFADNAMYYANTCVEEESGDVAGYVVIASPGEPLPSISLSWSEGALLLPVAAKITEYDRVSRRLSFSVHTEDGDFLFKGKIEPGRMEGILTTPWKASSERVELEARSRKAAFETGMECRPI